MRRVVPPSLPPLLAPNLIFGYESCVQRTFPEKQHLCMRCGQPPDASA